MIKIALLGGLDCIGMNMMAIECQGEIIIIDAGIKFPDIDMHGIDKIIPDFDYLLQRKKQIKGIFVTHGHEDHIGAISYFLEKIKVPVYATRLTLGLVNHKLSDRKLYGHDLITIDENTLIEFNHFKISFIRVSHSIPDGVMLVIDTPIGTIVHSGDFKIDYSPIDNKVINLKRIAKIGKKGVLALLSDSTNALKQGHTRSESKVGLSFDREFKDIKGRLLLATFSSNIHRVQQAIDTARRYGRKIVFSGKSMENTASIAHNLGYLNYDPSDIVPIREIDKYPDSQLMILTTGSQGEPLSALNRISNDQYRLLQIQANDTVIISALPIPGNEKAVYGVIDNLGRKGVRVIYEEASKMHVSGHAYSDELRKILKLLNPKYFLPIHGEFRHLKAHKEIAEDIGGVKKVLLAENGNVISIKAEFFEIIDKINLKDYYVDRDDVFSSDHSLLEERQRLAENGVIIFIFNTNKSKDIKGDIQVFTKGVISDDKSIITGIKDCIYNSYYHLLSAREQDMEKGLIENIQKYMYRKLGKKPSVMPIIKD